MKAQQATTTARLTKKTVFVYKNIKSQNNDSTGTVSDQSHTIIMTSWIADI